MSIQNFKKLVIILQVGKKLMELWCTQLHDLCKYENINEILYRPSIVPGGGAEQVWGAPAPSPHKTGTAYIIYTGPFISHLGV